MDTVKQEVAKITQGYPRYQLVCGEVKRLLSPDATIERLEGKKWVQEKQLH